MDTRRSIGSLVLVFLTAQTSSAAIIGLTNDLPEYSQTFDSLVRSGSVVWTNDETLGGWYASATLKWDGTLTASTGSSSGGDIYSFGATGNVERALGSIASGTPGDLFYGARFLNAGATVITELAIEYVGEQWRNNANANIQTLLVDYRLGGANFDNTGWTAAPESLYFLSPIHTGTTATLNGNLAANQSLLSGTIPGLAIAPGAEFWVRWYDRNDAGNDHGLAVDEFQLSATFADKAPLAAVPEPSSLALWGLGAIACIVFRRAKQNH